MNNKPVLVIIKYINLCEYFFLKEKFDNDIFKDIATSNISDSPIEKLSKTYEDVNILMLGRSIFHGNSINNGKIINIYFKIYDKINFTRPLGNVIVKKYFDNDNNIYNDLLNVNNFIVDDPIFVHNLREDILDILI